MVRVVVAQARQVVRRSGTAAFPFTLYGAQEGIAYGLEFGDPRLNASWHVRPGEAGGLELVVGARPERRLPVGFFALTLVATEAETGETARADLVLEVESCVVLGKEVLTFAGDTATLSVPVSSRCVFGFRCSGSVDYHHSSTNGDEIQVTAGSGPFAVPVTFPLGDRPFTKEDVEITVHSTDGTEISWRPGHEPTATWAPVTGGLGEATPEPVPARSWWARVRPFAVPVGIAAVVVVLGGAFAGALADDGSSNPGRDAEPARTTRPADSSSTGATTRSTGGKLPITGPDPQPPAGGKPVLVLDLESSALSAAANEPVTVTVVVRATPGGPRPTGSVEIKEGPTSLGVGTLSNGRIGFGLSKLSAAAHQLTAVYSGDSYYAPSTNTITQTVHRIGSSVTIAYSPPPGDCGPRTVTATVTAPDGSVPEGGVVFSIDGAESGPFPLDAGVASVSGLGLGNGSHSAIARYAGDPIHDGAENSVIVSVACPVT